MTIYYWDGIVNFNKAEFEGCQKQIIALLEARYTEAGLDQKRVEKARGYRIYTAKLDDSSRLAFTTIKMKGKSYILLLEVIADHDYQKAKFLDRAVYQQFMEKNAEWMQTQVIDREDYYEQAAPELERDEIPAAEAEIEPLIYYDKQFIHLSTDQNQAVSAAKPVIISGPPGSGKSCVALRLIADILRQRRLLPADEPQVPIIYVCKHKGLARHMQDLWQGFPESKDAEGQPFAFLQFKSYEELFQDYTIAVDRNQQVGAAEFAPWLQQHLQSRKRQNKLAGRDAKQLPSSAQLYIEFLSIAGCEDLAAYQSMGKKSSSVADKETRAWLWEIYTCYREDLEQNNWVNLHFKAPELRADLPAPELVVDEGQDLQAKELEFLIKLSVKKHNQRQIVICQDSKQDLFSSRPNILHCLALLHKEGQQVSEIQLQGSFRCAPIIVEAANKTLALRQQLSGQVDKHSYRSIPLDLEKNALNGRLHWLDPQKASDKTTLAEIISGYAEHELAVIIPEGLSEQAMQDIKRLVSAGQPEGRFFIMLTVAQIKGMQYPCILHVNPLDLPVFKQADKALRGQSIELAPEAFMAPLACLFTAETRAIESYVAIQTESHALATLMAQLKPAVLQSSEPSAQQSEPSKAEDWLLEIKRLLKAGNEAMAEQIYLAKLAGTKAGWPSFIESLYPQNRPEPAAAIASGSARPVAVMPEQSLHTENSPALEAATPTPAFSLNTEDRAALEAFFKDPLEAQRQLFLRDAEGGCLFLRLTQSQYSCLRLMLFLRAQKAAMQAISPDALSQIHEGAEPILASLSRSKWGLALLNECRAQEGFLYGLTAEALFWKRGADSVCVLQRIAPPTLSHLVIFMVTLNPAVIAAVTAERIRNFNELSDQYLLAFAIAAACVDDVAVLERMITLDRHRYLPSRMPHLLNFAARKASHRVIDFLFKLQVDLDAPIENGETAVFVAASENHAETLRLLALLGADLYICRQDGTSPATIAVRENCIEAVTMLQNLGCDLNRLDKAGDSPIYKAVAVGNISMIETLLDLGVNPDTRDYQGFTALHVAVKNGSLAICKLLYERGADMQVKSNHGATVVHIAVLLQQLEILQYFYQQFGAAFLFPPASDGLESPFELALSSELRQKRMPGASVEDNPEIALFFNRIAPELLASNVPSFWRSRSSPPARNGGLEARPSTTEYRRG